MRLLKCHIEGFGIYKNIDFTFDKDINTFLMDNGKGKSTLCAFIKSMFYGLKTTKNNKFDARIHYYSFEKGAFGGNLTFSHLGKEYRIERFFDVKSETKDTFKLYCNDLLSKDYSKKIGEELFELDEDSFERTLWIDSQDIAVQTTGVIVDRINSLVERTDFNFNFEETMEDLNKNRKELKADRGEGGLINEVNLKISYLYNEIRETELLNEELQKLYEEKTNNEKLLSDKKKLLQKAIDDKEILFKWNELEKLENELNESKVYFDKLSISIPNVQLFENSINSINKLTNDKELLLNKIETININEVKEFNDIKLSCNDILENGSIIAINEVIISAEESINEYNKRTYYDEEKLSKKEEDIACLFEDLNNINIINEVKTKLSLRNDLENKISSLKTNSKLVIKLLLFIISFALITSGSVLVFNNLILGIILITFGFCFLSFAFLYIRKKKNIIKKVEEDYQNINIYVKKLFKSLGFNDSLLVESLFDKLQEYESDYLIIKEKKNRIKNDYNENQIKLLELKSDIDNFFSRFGIISNDYNQSLIELKTNINTYNSFLKRRSNNKTIISDYEKEIVRKDELILSLVNALGYKDINDFRSFALIELDEVKKAKDNYDSLLKRVKLYKEQNLLLDKPTKINDIQALSNDVELLSKEYSNIESLIDSKKERIENLPVLKDNLDKQLELKESLCIKHDDIVKTIKCLRSAKDSLNNKYVKPLKDRMTYYLDKAMQLFGSKIVIDSDFNIKLDVNGEHRSEKHLSTGLLSICAFCYRLSLIDVIFGCDEKFIILDDSFSFLDEKNFKNLKDLLTNIDPSYQVLYFTCHTSRLIKK